MRSVNTQTLASTASAIITARAGSMCTSSLTDELGQFEVVAGDVLVGLPPVDIDVGERDTLGLKVAHPLAGMRGRIEVEILSVIVPHDLLLAFGRGQVKRIEDRRIRMGGVRRHGHIGIAALRHVTDDPRVENALVAEAQPVLCATGAVD